MDQRVQFIADYQRAVFDIAELARRYGISRKTAYKWIERYEIGGPAELVDRSRRPAHCPHRTPPAAHRQGRVENAFFRYKSIIGDGLRARSPAGQGSEAVLGCEILNRMTALGRPVSYRIGR